VIEHSVSVNFAETRLGRLGVEWPDLGRWRKGTVVRGVCRTGAASERAEEP